MAYEPEWNDNTMTDECRYHEQWLREEYENEWSDYEDEDDTTYLLKSDRNAERLFAAMNALEHGEGIDQSVESLRDEFGLTDNGSE